MDPRNCCGRRSTVSASQRLAAVTFAVAGMLGSKTQLANGVCTSIGSILVSSWAPGWGPVSVLRTYRLPGPSSPDADIPGSVEFKEGKNGTPMVSLKHACGSSAEVRGLRACVELAMRLAIDALQHMQKCAVALHACVSAERFLRVRELCALKRQPSSLGLRRLQMLEGQHVPCTAACMHMHAHAWCCSLGYERGPPQSSLSSRGIAPQTAVPVSPNSEKDLYPVMDTRVPCCLPSKDGDMLRARRRPRILHAHGPHGLPRRSCWICRASQPQPCPTRLRWWAHA